MKFIDADRLREKIAEQMELLPREIGRGAGTLTSKGYGMMEAFQIMRSIIESLQQEMWKPSEEQITAAKSAYSVLKSHDTWGEDQHLPILMSLISDLQKLL